MNYSNCSAGPLIEICLKKRPASEGEGKKKCPEFISGSFLSPFGIISK